MCNNCCLKCRMPIVTLWEIRLWTPYLEIRRAPGNGCKSWIKVYRTSWAHTSSRVSRARTMTSAAVVELLPPLSEETEETLSVRSSNFPSGSKRLFMTSSRIVSLLTTKLSWGGSLKRSGPRRNKSRCFSPVKTGKLSQTFWRNSRAKEVHL